MNLRPFAPKPGQKPAEEMPLLLDYELRLKDGRTVAVRAGFRDWDHWLAYVRQCWERNQCRARKPVEVHRLTPIAQTIVTLH